MASAIYDKAAESFLKGEIALLSDDIRLICVDSADYTPNTASDQYLTSIAAGGRVGVSGALQNKAIANRAFDADDITITGVSGDQFEYVVVYKHTGADATARLIAIFDSGTGLPFTPSGGDILIKFDSGTNKIFRL